MTRTKHATLLAAAAAAAALALPGSGAARVSVPHWTSDASAASGKTAGTRVVAERRTHKPKPKKHRRH